MRRAPKPRQTRPSNAAQRRARPPQRKPLRQAVPMPAGARKRSQAQALTWRLWLLPALLFFLALALLAVFIWSPVFRIRDIQVHQTHIVSAKDLIEVSGLREGQHFLSGFLGPVKAMLQGHYGQAEARIQAQWPRLKNISVRLAFPSVIHVNIHERIPIVFLDNGDNAVSLDSNGLVYDIVDDRPKNLPVIEGLRVLRMERNERLLVDVPEDLLRCMEVMNLIVEADQGQGTGSDLLRQIKSLRTHDYERVLLRLAVRGEEEDLTVVCTPNPYLKGHFIWLGKMLENNRFQARLPGRLELSGKHQIFTPRPLSQEHPREDE